MSEKMRSVMGMLLMVAIAGCSDSLTEPTMSESFAGTLAAGGTVGHEFTVIEPGDVLVTYESLAGSTATFGGGVGTPDGTGACVLQAVSESVTEGLALAAVAETAGTYCVVLYDLGALTAAIEYSLTVAHF